MRDPRLTAGVTTSEPEGLSQLQAKARRGVVAIIRRQRHGVLDLAYHYGVKEANADPSGCFVKFIAPKLRRDDVARMSDRDCILLVKEVERIMRKRGDIHYRRGRCVLRRNLCRSKRKLRTWKQQQIVYGSSLAAARASALSTTNVQSATR